MAPLPDHLMPAPSERPPLPREVRIEHQRRSVLDAATEVFAKRGYPGTTVDHIVNGARVGFASFYDLFDGKEDCFLRAYERIVEDAWEQIAAAVPAEASWTEQVCATLRAVLAAIAAAPLEARLALVEVQTAGPRALARYEQTHDAVVPLLRRGRELSPRAAALPATLEEATLGGVAWLLHQRLVMGEVEEIETLYPELVEIVIGPYLGEERTAELIAAPAPPA
ncbi:MAG TPA: TetR/AcrR family transcriptional regulator [Solirubrobacterales bacterium]